MFQVSLLARNRLEPSESIFIANPLRSRPGLQRHRDVHRGRDLSNCRASRTVNKPAVFLSAGWLGWLHLEIMHISDERVCNKAYLLSAGGKVQHHVTVPFAVSY